MIDAQITLLLIVAAVLLSAVLEQFVPRVSCPLIQIALGILIYISIGEQVDFTIDNNLFMFIFVAPLLYNEARTVNKETLIKNKGTILSLAIGLVVVITVVVGFSLNAIIPTIPLAAAFTLGAALGPTDSIAVTSLPDEVRLGPRREGILKGECLINDASGIVAFQFSLAALITGTFSAVDATTNFLILFFGGIIAGLVLGVVAKIVEKLSKKYIVGSTTFHVLFELFLPFIIYYAAETFHVSGILAVVTAGIINSGLFSRKAEKSINPEISKVNIVSSSVWEVLIFSLNGIVFVMLGVFLPWAMLSTLEDAIFTNSYLIVYSLIIVAVIILARFIWLLLIEYNHNKIKGYNLFCKENLQSAGIMTIGGAKGAVTMAMIFSLPWEIASGVYFPGRALIIFIAGVVVVVTLVLSNFMLPLIMPHQEKVKQQQEDDMKEQLAKVTIEILRKVIEDLNSYATDKNRHAIQNVINGYSKRIAMIKRSYKFNDKLNVYHRAKACEWEREFVLDQFNKQNIKPKLARVYLRQLNNKEDLLSHHTTFTWKIRNFVVRSTNFIKLLPKKTKNIAKGSYAQPGETMKFSTADLEAFEQPIGSMTDLKIAAYNHVIKKLDEEIKKGDAPSEDITNVLHDYRMQLQTLKDKSPSLSVIRTVNKETSKYAQIGFDLEIEYIKQKLENHEVTRSQYRIFFDNVLLMQLALEEF